MSLRSQVQRPSRGLAHWLTLPKRWLNRLECGVCGRFFVPLLLLMVILTTIGGIVTWHALTSDAVYVYWLLGLVVCGYLLLGMLGWLIRRDLLIPLTQIRQWTQQMRAGNMRARIPAPHENEYFELADDINEIGESLQSLTENMQLEVRKQTERIEQKNRTLKILYDVAASINISRDLDDLLSRFLHILIDVTGARAGMVRLLDGEGHMHLVSSVGMESQSLRGEYVVPINRCQCGKAVESGTVINKMDLQDCARYNQNQFFNDSEVELIAVPLVYQGRQLGIYNLFVERPNRLPGGEDNYNLLTSIGKHLGMAIDKARLDKEANQVTILEERNQLAFELHDSLAQTLASLRFQFRTLEESLRNGAFDADKQMAQLKGGIDESHREVRELIGHFRAAAEKQGLTKSLQKIIEKFRSTSGFSVVLQERWNYEPMSTSCELQILRIIQEALNNAHKHSEARTVRILLRGNVYEGYQVLIEDDGVGIPNDVQRGSLGDHIGLTIMEERAQRIGGTLTIDSEPGEGTQVLLRFSHPKRNADTQATAQNFL